MAWVTISLRKMVLKQRISSLEARLIEISQQQQSLANNSSYEQQVMNAGKDFQYNILDADIQNGMMSVMQRSPGANASPDERVCYNAQLSQVRILGLAKRAELDEIFKIREGILQSESDRKARALEAEQVQLEVQLKAARAEEEQLSQAMDKDIEKGAIKLA